MGYISLTVLATSTFLIAYSLLLSGVKAELSNPSGGGLSQMSNEALHKRPAVWLKTFPGGLKTLNSYAVYRRDLPPSNVEFVDESMNNMEKKFDDYGHMRFGKRGGEGDGFDDYGHMRFGR